MKGKFKIGDFITTEGDSEICSDVIEIVGDRHNLDWICKHKCGRISWVVKSASRVWRLATDIEIEKGHRDFIPVNREKYYGNATTKL